MDRIVVIIVIIAINMQATEANCTFRLFFSISFLVFGPMAIILFLYLLLVFEFDVR